MACSDRTSRGELLSTAAVQGSTTKSDGVWELLFLSGCARSGQCVTQSRQRKKFMKCFLLIGFGRIVSFFKLNILPFYQFTQPSVAVSPFSGNPLDLFDSFSVRLL